MRSYVDTYLVRGDHALRRGLLVTQSAIPESQAQAFSEAGMNLIAKTPLVLSTDDMQFLYSFTKKNRVLTKPRFVLVVGSSTESSLMTSNLGIATRNLIINGWEVEVVAWDIKNQLNLKRGLVKLISETGQLDVIRQARIVVAKPFVFRSLLSERVSVPIVYTPKGRGSKMVVVLADSRSPPPSSPTPSPPVECTLADFSPSGSSPGPVSLSPGLLKKESPPFLSKKGRSPAFPSDIDVSVGDARCTDVDCDDWSSFSIEIMLTELGLSAQPMPKRPIARAPVRYDGKFGPITAPNRTLTWDKLVFRAA